MRKWIAVTVAVLVVVAGVAAFLLLGQARPTRRRPSGGAQHGPLRAHRDPRPRPPAVDRRRDVSRPLGVGGHDHARAQDHRDPRRLRRGGLGSALDALDGCTQALRARYETEDGAVSGQFLIFNLADSAAADRLVAALGSGGFVRPAPGTPEGFDGSRSWAQARALGHYATVSWVAPVAEGAGWISPTRRSPSTASAW